MVCSSEYQVISARPELAGVILLPIFVGLA